MNDQEDLLVELRERILKSRKYRQLGLNPDTVADLIRGELKDNTSEKILRKNVRRKLHNIVAPYLGELDYSALSEQLDQMGPTSLGDENLKNFALVFSLNMHRPQNDCPICLYSTKSFLK